MSSVRTEIANALAAALPEYKVYDYGILPSNVPGQQVALSVERSEVKNSAFLGKYDNTLTITIMTGAQEPQRAEDLMDPAVDDVLHVLRTSLAFAGVTFESATRVIVGRTESFTGYQAWSIEITAQSDKD